MPAKAALLQLSRKVHLYFGLFISPALLFFAVTGGYQTLGLHEASSNYKPPQLLAELGQIHKKQTHVLPVRRPTVAGGESREGRRPDTSRTGDAGPVGASPSGSSLREGVPQGKDNPGAPPALRPGGPPQITLQAKQKQHLPLKLFFVVVSLGLLTSTFTGIYMAYKYDRNRMLVTGLLVAGVVIPLFLLRY